MGSQDMLHTIEANLVSSTQGVSGELSISQSSVIWLNYDIDKSIWIVYNITKLLQNFWHTQEHFSKSPALCRNCCHSDFNIGTQPNSIKCLSVLTHDVTIWSEHKPKQQEYKRSSKHDKVNKNLVIFIWTSSGSIQKKTAES